MSDWLKKDRASEEEECPDDTGIDERDIEQADGEVVAVLLKDADLVRQSIQLSEESLLTSKLHQALADGMEKGRKRSARQRGKRMSLQLSAAVLAMLFVLTAFVRISPGFAAIVKDIPGFAGFVELVSYDGSLQSAIDNEYIQVVGKSDERNGYTFTVNGVIADAQRVVLLYTAEGPGISEEDTPSLSYELKNENGGNVVASIGSAHYFREKDNKDSVVQDYLDIMMAPGEPVPHEIQFKLELGSEWLEVQVPIDHSRFDEMTEVIDLNQTIEVEGQRIEIKKAVITPLQVSITFKSASGNEKRLNDFIDLELVDERGRSYQTKSGMGDLDTEIVRHFQSSYFQKPETLTLKAKGLLMSDRGMKVVIDTEQGKLLEAPDGRLKLGEARQSGEAIDLSFELSQADDPQTVMRDILLFGFNGVVRDAEGTAYSITRGTSYGTNGTTVSRFGAGDRHRVTYYYNIPNEEYVQPLTIEIEQYLGHAFKEIAIPIK
ncbi:hypothetical protein PAT3040_03721 [Paenibacillus agaridevorans]|uniref:DUF4179 domain-containing protein n=1 Tax=Paenibacillus agaridevorans TaxID=171404 RepID=A0A2R5F0I8_9BACL|nr:DUF4179 domain-containing protein [Paenibacillus agaridevorans]GBG09094.1 hypothetical protein PAT3040_03721 [Paenibacillus agaridevorans]